VIRPFPPTADLSKALESEAVGALTSLGASRKFRLSGPLGSCTHGSVGNIPVVRKAMRSYLLCHSHAITTKRVAGPFKEQGSK
jgi:hypothetical protein